MDSVLADHINNHDTKQSFGSDEARRCPEHGDRLTVTGNGQALVCLRVVGKTEKGYKLCSYGEPLGA